MIEGVNQNNEIAMIAAKALGNKGVMCQIDAQADGLAIRAVGMANDIKAFTVIPPKQNLPTEELTQESNTLIQTITDQIRMGGAQWPEDEE